MADGAAQDAAGNVSKASLPFTRIFDSTPPTVTLSSSAASTTATTPIPVTITFNEAVTGLTLLDLTVSGAAPSAPTGSGTTYQVSLTPSGNGPVSISLAADVVQDAAGNGNAASTTLNRTLIIPNPVWF